ncbi:Camk1, partial [Symbiodinium sp. KB8]
VGAFIFYEFEKRPREASKPTSRVDIGTIYDLRRELGKGTFGVVYLARHRVTGEQCAIKMIRKRKLQQSAYTMEEVEAESRLMVNLKHPYLARLQSSWHDRDHIYLVMVRPGPDLYTGGELFARIVEGKGVYPEPQAKLITLRLLLAIQYLHEHNIAHRDLKPENVMIASTDDDTDVRIVDFGGAKQLRGSGYRSYVGSHQYMAPEVVGRKGSVLKRGRYDQGCDMWSLGIIVYVIISAYTPFTGDAVASSGGRIAWGFNPPAAWKDVSPQCKDLIRHLLDPDQEERLSADEALMHPWLADLYRQWS